MAQGIKALRQIQMCRESTTQGTSSTDYRVWRGTGTLADLREVTFPPEDIGIIPGVTRSYIAKSGGEVRLEGTANFEQLGYILDAAIHNATPTTDTGTGTAYIRTYTFPIVTSDYFVSTDLMTYGFKVGDNAEVEKANFGFIPEFTLSGNAGEALMLSATYQTRQVDSDSDGFDAGATTPTVESMLVSKGNLYVDVSTDAPGTTVVSNTLLGVNLQVKTGWIAVLTADGRLDFSFIKQVQPEITLQLTMEWNATAIAEKQKWRDQTVRNLQLKFTGNALTTAGAYTYKTLKVNLTGKWETFDVLDEKDGNDIVSGTFRARYDSTAALFASMVLVNEVATL